MFKWLKSLFSGKFSVDVDGLPLPDEKSGEVRLKFRLPTGKEFWVYAIDPKKVKKQ